MAESVGRPKKDIKDKQKFQLVSVRKEDYILFRKKLDEKKKKTGKDYIIADILGLAMRNFK